MRLFVLLLHFFLGFSLFSMENTDECSNHEILQEGNEQEKLRKKTYKALKKIDHVIPRKDSSRLQSNIKKRKNAKQLRFCFIRSMNSIDAKLNHVQFPTD